MHAKTFCYQQFPTVLFSLLMFMLISWFECLSVIEECLVSTLYVISKRKGWCIVQWKVVEEQ